MIEGLLTPFANQSNAHGVHARRSDLAFAIERELEVFSQRFPQKANFWELSVVASTCINGFQDQEAAGN